MKRGFARWAFATGLVVCGAALTARQLPPPPPPSMPSVVFRDERGTPAKATGAISGVVLDRATGAPVGGASVLISQRGNGQGFTPVRFNTDQRGRFVVRNLPPSEAYNVMASKAGFFEAYFGSTDATYTDAQSVNLAEGQWVSNIEIKLTRQGVIAGRVVDEAGEPLVGAYVRTLAEVFVAGTAQIASADFARTDDRGEYRIGGLRDGRYFVYLPSVQHSLPSDLPAPARTGPPRPDPTTVPVDADTRIVVGSYLTPPPPDASPRAYPSLFFPGVRTIAEANAIQVRPGQTQTADFRVQAVQTWRVAGRVETTEGSATGLLLRLVAPGLEDLGIGSEAATTVVDAQGRFVFVNVPPGRYFIDARTTLMEYRYTEAPQYMMPFPTSPAFAMQSSGAGTIQGAAAGTMYSYISSSGGGDLVGRLAIDVGGRDLTVVLPLRRTARLSGRLQRETDDDSAVPAPAPGPNAFRGVVQAQPANGSASLGMQSGQLLEDGRFEIPGLLTGPYLLKVLGVPARSITWSGKDMTNTPFDVTAGQDITDVVVTTTTKTTSLGGTVRRSSAGDSTVLVFPVERELWSNYGFQPQRLLSISAAANGSYRAQPPGGEYYAIAVDSRFARDWRQPVFLAKIAPLATRVTVEWGGKTTQDLPFVEVPR